MNKRLVLITGVSSGIGYQIAKDLLEQNYKILGVSRSFTSKAEELTTRYPKNFIFEPLNLVEDIDSLPKWLRSQAKIHGQFYGLVHSAGVQQILPLQFNNYSKMLEVFNLNVFVGLSLAKGITDKRVINPNGGSIVFLSSIAAIIGETGLVNYAASKAALNGAMRAMAKELAGRKIRVNSVLPGFVMTEMIEKWQDVYSKDYIENMNRKYPLGIGKPEDVSGAVSYLLGDKSNWVTGCEFNINGGASLGN